MDERDGQEHKGRGPNRAVLRRRLSYAVAVLVTLAIAFIIYSKSQFLPNRVSRYVNEHYLKGTPFEFSCGGVSGDLVNHVVLRDVVLRYNSDRASFNVVRIAEVSIDYEIRQLLRLNLMVDDLRLREVSVQVRRAPDGSLIVPAPAGRGNATASATAVSPRIDVRHFAIDGLHLLFGGAKRELAVRDVNLAGSFTLEDGVGHLEIDNGKAFVANSETSISSVRLDVEHEGGTVRLNDFVARLDESFLMANGGYRAGRLQRVQLVFNPVSLDELHLLGLIPDLHGQFGGNVVLDGGLDSLGVSGRLTGRGLGVVLGGMSFAGVLHEGVLDLDRIDGDVYGARLRGAFRYNLTGSPDFLFDGTVSDLDITQGFVAGHGLPATHLDGHLRMSHDASADSYAFDASLDSAVVGGYRAGRTRMVARWTPGRGLQVDRMEMIRPGYTMHSSGTIDDKGVFDTIFDVRGTDLSYFWRFFGLPRVDAGVAVSGRMIGPADDMQINLSGRARDLSFLTARIDTASVQAEIRGVGGSAPRARVDLHGGRLALAGRSFTSPHVFLEAGHGGTEVRDLSFAQGDTTVTAEFHVAAEDGGVDVLLRHLAIEHPGEVWRLDHSAKVRYAAGEVSADSLVLASAAGVVGVVGEYSETRAWLDGTAWGENVNLGVIGDALGVPVRLAGQGGFRVSARGGIDNPRVEAHVHLADGVVDSLVFDRLDLDARFDGKGYALDGMTLVSARDTVTARGTWGLDVSPVGLLRGGSRRARIAAAPLRIEAQVNGLPLPKAGRIFHHAVRFGGAFTGAVTVTGTATAPEIDVAGTVAPLAGFAVAMPPLTIKATCAGGTLRLDELRLEGNVGAVITGAIPLTISFLAGVHVDRDGPVDLRVKMPEGAVRLDRYWERVSVLAGSVEGDVRITGKLGSPRFGGTVTVRDGVVQVVGMVERFENVDGTFRFVDNVLKVSSLAARSDKGGTVSGSGSITFAGWHPEGYQIDVVLRQLWIRSIPDFEVLQDGRLQVTSVEWSPGRRIPNITGKLVVREATIRREFTSGGAQRASITMPTAAPAWVCTIDIDAENNVWVRNSDLRMELGGKLILKRDEQGLYLRGNLNVLRGAYTVYGNRFQIVDGSLDFSTASLRPEIEVNAYTPHRGEGGVERRIYLNLSWPRDKKEPAVTLSYDEPGYHESDIWRMLGGSDLAGGLAANTLERLLNEQMGDVSVEVEQRPSERGSTQGTPEQELMIGVGKYLWEDVYLRYRQGLSIATERQVEVEYRISNMFLIRSELIRHARRGYVGINRQNADEFNLDLRFRFEF